MLFQAPVRLGRARMPMGVVRRGLDDQLPHDARTGRFFVVRHADDSVCATATADTVDDLEELVDGLMAAGQHLTAVGVLEGMSTPDAAPQVEVRLRPPA